MIVLLWSLDTFCKGVKTPIMFMYAKGCRNQIAIKMLAQINFQDLLGSTKVQFSFWNNLAVRKGHLICVSIDFTLASFVEQLCIFCSIVIGHWDKKADIKSQLAIIFSCAVHTFSIFIYSSDLILILDEVSDGSFSTKYYFEKVFSQLINYLNCVKVWFFKLCFYAQRYEHTVTSLNHRSRDVQSKTWLNVHIWASC